MSHFPVPKMGVIGGRIGVELLNRIAPGGNGMVSMDGSAYGENGKLRMLLGDELLARLVDRDVVDFGCGTGGEAIELVRLGARRVIGVDIQESFLTQARECARAAGVAERTEFVREFGGSADAIVSVDAFEHFDDPAHILRIMRGMLPAGGEVIVSFGPTWYHPLGGHLFSVFPWAHLLFTERALIKWRSGFKTDGATRFNEVAGGLNQMTIRRFRRLVAASDFIVSMIEPVPIRKLAPIHSRLTEEFTTAIVRARMIAN